MTGSVTAVLPACALELTPISNKTGQLSATDKQTSPHTAPYIEPLQLSKFSRFITLVPRYQIRYRLKTDMLATVCTLEHELSDASIVSITDNIKRAYKSPLLRDYVDNKAARLNHSLNTLIRSSELGHEQQPFELPARTFNTPHPLISARRLADEHSVLLFEKPKQLYPHDLRQLKRQGISAQRAGCFKFLPFKGEGVYGTTMLVKDMQQKRWAVMKEMHGKKEETKRAIISNEIDINTHLINTADLSGYSKRYYIGGYAQIGPHKKGGTLFMEAGEPIDIVPYYREQTPIKRKNLICLLAAAIKQLHAQGVTHRDLKPANILLKDEHFAVIDFGLSERSTYCQTHAGSSRYSAPEVRQDLDKKLNKPTDIYSFGLIIAEMVNLYRLTIGSYTVAGIMDIRNDYIKRVNQRIANDQLETCSIEKLIAEMISIAPEERPTIEEVEKRLKEADLMFF